MYNVVVIFEFVYYEMRHTTKLEDFSHIFIARRRILDGAAVDDEKEDPEQERSSSNSGVYL